LQFAELSPATGDVAPSQDTDEEHLSESRATPESDPTDSVSDEAGQKADGNMDIIIHKPQYNAHGRPSTAGTRQKNNKEVLNMTGSSSNCGQHMNEACLVHVLSTVAAA